MSSLYKTFVGEFVKVILNVNASETESNENESYTRDTPLTVDGYLLEQDKEYIYLGITQDQVDVAIKKDLIALVQVVSTDIYDQLLDKLPNPSNKKNFN